MEVYIKGNVGNVRMTDGGIYIEEQKQTLKGTDYLLIESHRCGKAEDPVCFGGMRVAWVQKESAEQTALSLHKVDYKPALFVPEYESKAIRSLRLRCADAVADDKRNEFKTFLQSFYFKSVDLGLVERVPSFIVSTLFPRDLKELKLPVGGSSAMTPETIAGFFGHCNQLESARFPLYPMVIDALPTTLKAVWFDFFVGGDVEAIEVFSKCKAIRSLNVNESKGIQFSDAFINALPENLEVLDLGSTNISVEAFTKILKRCTHLKALNVSYCNNLLQNTTWVSMLPKGLEVFHLGGMGGDGYYVSRSDLKIDHTMLEQLFVRCPGLASLDIGQCEDIKCTEDLFSKFPTSLKAVRFIRQEFSAGQLGILAKRCPDLEHLVIGHNSELKLTPDTVEACFPESLTHLMLAWQGLDGDSLRAILSRNENLVSVCEYANATGREFKPEVAKAFSREFPRVQFSSSRESKAHDLGYRMQNVLS